VKERPILFSAPMVRAILAGRKTVTRRTIKRGVVVTCDDNVGVADVPCPYGDPGDRLWVKEAWRAGVEWDRAPPLDIDPYDESIWFEATETPLPAAKSGWGKRRPSLFMCRWMSRILLNVASVRAERLQAITDAEARAEGLDGVTEFAALWDTINGPGSWDADPWVWRVAFTRSTA